MATIYDIALTLLPRIGPKHIIQLLEIFGSADRVLTASADELRMAGLSPLVVESLTKAVDYRQAEYIVQICTHKNIRILVRTSPQYPYLLAQCPDAPHILYVNGELDLNAGKWVAIVGTRKATVSGVSYVNEIVRSLASGFSDTVIVSGLAFGIDKAAHTASMDSHLPTVAVMAGWVEDIVPPSHFYIARRILVSGGAIVSDMPPGTIIKGSNFLSRNRIIAGLSHLTIVAESGAKGGSLVTADIAASYNRPVFAVPGRSEDQNFAGTNALIKNTKAILYQDPSDIATELGWRRETLVRAVENPAITGSLTGMMLTLFTMMPDTEPVTLEEMAARCHTELHTASSILMALETRGLIKSLQGRLYQKCKY
ncbi:MAG: DNA-processing protein DprA [Mucinivorans sp.]